MRDKRLRNVQYMMLFVNIVAVLFPASLICFTTQKVCSFFHARSFIGKLDALPVHPTVILLECIALTSCIVVSFVLREFVFTQRKYFVYLSLCFDFVISIYLMVLLNFNYNGILFWVFANIIYHVQDTVKLIFVLLAICIYVGTNQEFLMINYRLYSMNDYIDYYNASIQKYMLGGYNVLISFNIIIFIVFCIYVIQKQQNIIEQVNSLYKQLSEKNGELENANEELKQLADLKEKMGQTKERNRLAREIHDTLGHTLTGISAGVDACLTMIDRDPQATKKQLELISKVTRDGIGEVRCSVNELRPDALERLNLEEAVRNMIADMKAVSKAEVIFVCEPARLQCDEDEENTIYRIVQESLTNALRHGKADKIWVDIRKRDSVVHLRIRDNGCGCKEMKRGFGTTHMQERIHMLHGTIRFNGENGFVVEADIPVRWGKEEQV